MGRVKVGHGRERLEARKPFGLLRAPGGGLAASKTWDLHVRMGPALLPLVVRRELGGTTLSCTNPAFSRSLVGARKS